MKLDESLLTAAELLRRQGYATALFSNNPHLGAWLKFNRGFEHAPPIYQFQRFEAITPACWIQWLGWVPPVSWLDADTCTAYTGVFIAHWLDRLRPKDRPWFAFVNYMDVHLPIIVPKRYRRMFLDDAALRRSYRLRQRAYGGPLGIEFPFRYIALRPDGVEAADADVLRGQYDAALRYLDDRLCELIEAMEQRGLLDDTYVIITSDHGDAHGEHGLWSHMFGVYDTLARVPLIVRHPGGTRTADIPTNVQLSDLFATVARWAGVPPERLPRFCSPPLPERVEPSALERVAVAEWLAPPRSMLERVARRAPEFDPRRLHRRLRGLIQGRYKFIWSSQGDNELYDLANDPLERTNLVATSRSTAARLEARLKEWLAAQEARVSTTGAGLPAEAAPVQVPADVADQLRKLGYVE
jgi:arylsulfatase A-like enzyme